MVYHWIAWILLKPPQCCACRASASQENGVVDEVTSGPPPQRLPESSNQRLDTGATFLYSDWLWPWNLANCCQDHSIYRIYFICMGCTNACVWSMKAMISRTTTTTTTTTTATEKAKQQQQQQQKRPNNNSKNYQKLQQHQKFMGQWCTTSMPGQLQRARA